MPNIKDSDASFADRFSAGSPALENTRGINPANLDPMTTLPPGYTIDGTDGIPKGFQWETPPAEAANLDPAASLPPGYTIDGTAAPSPKSSTAADMVKQLGSGVVEGIEGLPTSAVRSIDAAAHGINWVLTKTGLAKPLGITPEGTAKEDAIAAVGQANMQRNVPSVPLPAPETTAGEYARTIGNFAPAGLLGTGGLVRRAAQVVAPAVASEGAGQLAQATGNPDLENVARIAGAVLGGAGENSLGRGTPKVPLPTADDLRDAARSNYNQVAQMGVAIKPQPIANLATKIESDLTDKGLTVRNVPETYGVIRTLQNPPSGSVMRAQDFENARQELVQAKANASNPREAVAANHAIGALDSYLANIPHSDVLSGDAKAVSALYDTARQNWAAASRLDQVNAKTTLADLNASTAGSGANIDNATRQAVKQLVRPDKYGKTQMQKSGFTPDEIAAANIVAQGTIVGNALRAIGKLGPTGGLMGNLHAAAAWKTGGVSIPTFTVPALVAKFLGDRSTANGANRLSDMVAARSPLARSMAPATPAPGLSANDIALIAGVLAPKSTQRTVTP